VLESAAAMPTAVRLLRDWAAGGASAGPRTADPTAVGTLLPQHRRLHPRCCLFAPCRTLSRSRSLQRRHMQPRFLPELRSQPDARRSDRGVAHGVVLGQDAAALQALRPGAGRVDQARHGACAAMFAATGQGMRAGT